MAGLRARVGGMGSNDAPLSTEAMTFRESSALDVLEIFGRNCDAVT